MSAETMKLTNPVSHGSICRTRSAAGFLVTEARYEPGVFLPRHAHDLPGLTFVVEGSCEETLHGATFDCLPGTVVIKPPSAPHTNRYGPTGARCVFVEIEPWRYDHVRPHTDAFEAIHVARGGVEASIAARLVAALRAPAARAALQLEALILDLIANAAERHAGRERAPAWVVTAHEFIREDFAHIRSVADVAGAAGVHPVQLSRGFRVHAGHSVWEFLVEVRLERAATALVTTARPIGQIAVSVGFADQSHFTHAFTRRFHRSPARYRQHFRVAELTRAVLI
jgi:AraC family transcriptional regulator